MTFEHAGAVATKIVDRWAWWQAALADPRAVGKSLPVHENEPQQGYFRVKNKAGGYDPVAIFYPDDSDTLVAYRANREVDAGEIWTWACRQPVTYDAYQQAIGGDGWPDDDPTVASQVAPPPPGHNSGAIDEAETLRDQIEAAKQGADAYREIRDDGQLTKAQSLRARLLELSNEAVKRHKKEKEPHLEAGRAVDKKWFPLRDEAKTVADAIRQAMSAWETEKLRRQREAERKAEEARRKAEEEARKAEEAGKPAPEPTLALEPEPVAAPAPAPIKGTYGKAASVSVKLFVKDVTDWTALATYMSGHPELQDTLRKLAQRALDAGRTNIPGITTEERANVR